MTNIGIDLGTTNSVICSYDGNDVTLYKSPEQHDVTPSAIFFGRRGNKYVGARAYTDSVRNPKNAALLFKRFMGRNHKIKIEAADLILTPEECSAEILRAVHGYLPEDVRTAKEGGTVVTVPAAFNQVQNAATKTAAELAGLGEVQLIQEPVAAVMSVMRKRETDGTFLIYDIGGGTLDVAIAESIAGRVNILAHGGIEMCGGRDFDRTIYDNVVKPWLFENFNLPKNISADPKYHSLFRMAQRAAELAKIELSQRDSSNVVLDETQLSVQDIDGEEIYIDIEVGREEYNKLISSRIEESIEATKGTIENAGLRSEDIEKIVFIGGPAQYKPHRDIVASELAISASTEVNPMTAVAEGAAIFGETIDWSTQNRTRKSGVGKLQVGESLDIELRYGARTPAAKSRLVIKLGENSPANLEFQVDNSDTGWSSGRMNLEDGVSIELTLSNRGDNEFRIFVFDQSGSVIPIPEDKIVVTRTAASIDAIPASHSVGLEVLANTRHAQTELHYLVRAGDQLPKCGKVTVKPIESLKAGSHESINFRLWQGEIEDPITDNKPIGAFKITGADIEKGVIPAGENLICHYKMDDSGTLKIEVEIESKDCLIPAGKDFYSPQEDMVDYEEQANLIEQRAESSIEKVDAIAEKIDDPRLTSVRDKLEAVVESIQEATDAETAKEASDKVEEVNKVLARVREENKVAIRQMELDAEKGFFDRFAREHARDSEATSFDNLVKTAEKLISSRTREFEACLSELKSRISQILYRQDEFAIDLFKRLARDPYMYFDKTAFEGLVREGIYAMKEDDMRELRRVISQLFAIRIDSIGEDEDAADINIIRG